MIPIVHLREDELDALVAGISIDYNHPDAGTITISPPAGYVLEQDR